MMNERDAKLIKCYGPRFVERGKDISTTLLHMEADAYSTMPREEADELVRAIEEFIPHLNKALSRVWESMRELGIEIE